MISGDRKIHDLTHHHTEKAILVGVVSQNQTAEQVDEYLDELAFWPKQRGNC